MATIYDTIAVIIDKARDHANEAREDRHPATMVLAMHELAAAVSQLAELSEKHERRLSQLEWVDGGGHLRDILLQANGQLVAERNELHTALRFARSAIKSGEPWSETCEEVIDGALAKVKGAKDHD